MRKFPLTEITMDEAEEVSNAVIALEEYCGFGVLALFHILNAIRKGMTIKRSINFMKNEIKEFDKPLVCDVRVR